MNRNLLILCSLAMMMFVVFEGASVSNTDTKIKKVEKALADFVFKTFIAKGSEEYEYYQPEGGINITNFLVTIRNDFIFDKAFVTLQNVIRDLNNDIQKEEPHSEKVKKAMDVLYHYLNEFYEKIYKFRIFLQIDIQSAILKTLQREILAAVEREGGNAKELLHDVIVEMGKFVPVDDEFHASFKANQMVPKIFAKLPNLRKHFNDTVNAVQDAMKKMDQGSPLWKDLHELLLGLGNGHRVFLTQDLMSFNLVQKGQKDMKKALNDLKIALKNE